MKNIFDVLDKKLFDEYLEEAKEYGYGSLVLCVIDSVFSISAKYESTYKVVERFAEYVNINIQNDEYKVRDFLRDFSDVSYEQLATDIFKNRQRTSTANGILKAEAVYHFINVLNEFNIQTKGDILNFKDKELLKSRIALIKGQKSGITFEYLLMLAGDTERFKPDRHIYNFFENYLEYGKLDEMALKDAFISEYKVIQKSYPRFNIRMFDNLIWKFMKSREDHFIERESIELKQPSFLSKNEWYYFDQYDHIYYLTNEAPREAIKDYLKLYRDLNDSLISKSLSKLESTKKGMFIQLLNLQKLYNLIGYEIDENLAMIAISCSGFANEIGITNQDALAVVGDHVLKVILSSKRFKDNIKISKGDLTVGFQKEENNKRLQELGKLLKITDFLFWNNTDLDGDKKIATSLEAIIGAIYLSKGIEASTEFCNKINLV